MDEGLTVILFVLLLGLLIFLACFLAAEKSRKEREKTEEKLREEKRKNQEEEQRRQRIAEEKRKEEEEKKKTKCYICGKCSYGNPVCTNCFERSNPIAKELPLQKTKNYESLIKYRQEIIDKTIFADTKIDREFNSIRLLALTNILKNKYHVEDIWNQTFAFLKDLSEEEYSTSDELIANYASYSSQKEKNKEKEEDEDLSEPTDYRNIYPKPYRCEDGDYVRSKAEREIDDFFFNNRIWHIYESEYINPETNQKYYPDFYLPDFNLYIEYFGLNTDTYLQKAEQKREMFTKDPNIQFEQITFNDDAIIKEKLAEVCKKHNIPLK